jgi:hypothetical protein
VSSPDPSDRIDATDEPPRSRRVLRIAGFVLLSLVLGLLSAGILILAGVDPDVGWPLGGVVTVAALLALRWQDRRSAVAQEQRARTSTRSMRSILLSAAVSIAAGAMLGALVGQVGRGAVIGSILTPAVDATRSRIQARHR